MTKRMKRFQIINSREFHGKYEVKDCKTGETYKFHNLASARVWAEAQNKEVEKEINHNLTYNYDLLGIGKTECDNCIELNNIVKIFVDQNNFTDHLDHLSNINIPVIKTNSQLVNTYGGWICIKKYQTE